MSDTFLAAVVDALLPGGALANSIVAPKASSIGIATGLVEARHARVLAAIADLAGGEDAFCSGTEEFRIEVLKRAEAMHPQDFAALVTAVLTGYYEHPDVLTAFGWPARPPQPLGHTFAPIDEDLLAPVKARGEIWRRT
jgi:hypothetical protein